MINLSILHRYALCNIFQMQKLARKLFMFHSTNESLHQLNHHVELRALLSPVHITAMGLVNFDLTLVPNVSVYNFGTSILLEYAHTLFNL